ncbi:MAG: polysaccharide biosynthesis/export family protein [Planctomycetes bacterium]|nr:polysaccharide biosynthesis/export family protein [Planctomycetota bacterium]
MYKVGLIRGWLTGCLVLLAGGPSFAQGAAPEYRIEPPDMVAVELRQLKPRSPYLLEVYDCLQIDVTGTLLDQPINGGFLVEAEGIVNLGPAYGSVRVVGNTVKQARRLIADQLKPILRRPKISVRLLRTSGLQPIGPPNNQYMVGPDGTINLDMYGTVHIAGKTLTEAELVIEKHLAQFLDGPVVSLKVSHNSKVYYIITQGTDLGDNVVRVPITGKATVRKAIRQVVDKPYRSDEKKMRELKIWLARPAPGNVGCEQVLEVDGDDIARGEAAGTNYQLMPGDRVYIMQEDRGFDLKEWLSDWWYRLRPPPEVQRYGGGSGSVSMLREYQEIGREHRINED